jgi:UDP-glucose 4-epimerase
VDLAKAHVSSLLKMNDLPNCFEAFNLGTGQPCSVLELIRLFEKETGVSVPHEIGPRRPGDIEKVYADPSKSYRMLNWRTELTVAEALRDAWKWEKELAHETY